MKFTWDRNVEITAADIPGLTEEIIFGDDFNQPIGENVLPNSLRYIAFGYDFNQQLGENVLPDSLKTIRFGHNFNQPIGENVLPNSLKTIDFEWRFNQPIEENVLPNSLETIEFGYDFNQPIGENVLPDSLKTIEFGHKFNQPIGENVLPDRLEFIKFDCNFNHLIGENVLPRSIKCVEIGMHGYSPTAYNHSISALYDLNNLEHLSLHTKNYIKIDVDCLPSSLKYLSTSNQDIALSLNSESQRMWFSVIFTDVWIPSDLTYPILWPSVYGYREKYEVIGTETVDCNEYNITINPECYQPRSNAKSARK